MNSQTSSLKKALRTPLQAPRKALVSVVVPLYIPHHHQIQGIQSSLATFLEQFPDDDDSEILLSDSGSDPKVESVVREILAKEQQKHPWVEQRVTYLRVKTKESPLSRAQAMNLGVQRTQGEILLFLHIDCQLPAGALDCIREVVENGAQGGGFTKQYSGKPRFSPLAWTEFYLNQVRTVKTRRLVGTNAIFLTRDLAREHPYQGSFLEDVEMSDWLLSRLRPGALRIIPKAVTVSARKYLRYGPWASIAINAAVMILYRLFRVHPERLRKQLYHRKFPKDMTFWLLWLGTFLSLLDAGGRKREQ